MRGTRIDPEACGILCPVKRVDGGKGSADSTSSPANSILRAKGPRHDRTHDQRNAEIAPDQRALSRCRFGKSLSRWPFHLARLSLSSSMWPSALAASVTLSSRPRRWLAVPARGPTVVSGPQNVGGLGMSLIAAAPTLGSRVLALLGRGRRFRQCSLPPPAR
jgi:hypothetical protein